MKIRNKKELKVFRTQLHKNMPAPELVFWQVIRNEALGTKFRRQFSFENHIFDFYAPMINLAIEIDGDSHYIDRTQQIQDAARDERLDVKYGIKVLRFTNRDVMTNLDGVVLEIIKHLPPLHLPLRMGEKSRWLMEKNV